VSLKWASGDFTLSGVQRHSFKSVVRYFVKLGMVEKTGRVFPSFVLSPVNGVRGFNPGKFFEIQMLVFEF
jgi:hypothetical protein